MLLTQVIAPTLSLGESKYIDVFTGFYRPPGFSRAVDRDTDFDWEAFLDEHSQSDRIRGPGVVSFCVESIYKTQDPNRRGKPRVDFVVRRVDGSAVRLHPGLKRAGDAKPVFHEPGSFTEQGRPSASGAVMYDAQRRLAACGGADQPAVFTVGDTAVVPQQDRLGRKKAVEEFSAAYAARLRVGALCTARGYDVTTTEVPWERWLGNLGHRQADAVGLGVQRVFLSADAPDGSGVSLVILRLDGSCVRVKPRWSSATTVERM